MSGVLARQLTQGLITAALAGLTACMSAAPAGPSNAAQTAVPARWMSPDAACLSDAQTFAATVTGRRVSLGSTAFEHSAELVLEPVAPRDAQGRVLDGRRRETQAEVFRLELHGPVCVMTHRASGRSAPMPACRCAAQLDRKH